MAVPALSASLIRNQRGKEYMGTVLLESSTAKPYGKIVGKLVLRADSELKHFGIRIQFEAVCNLQFETKFDSRVTHHKKTVNLLTKAPDSDSEGYWLSPVLVEVVESRQTAVENQMQTMQGILHAQPTPHLPPARPYVIQPGIHNFGFELAIDNLDYAPAPFRSPYGNLVYKVVAYIKNEHAVYTSVADKSVRFPGYHNLALNEEAEKPILLERTLKKSVFSNKKFVHAELKVDKSGYLPDEDIPFNLNINNPKLMALSSVAVSLVQKVTYVVSGASKTTTNTLDTKEYNVKEPQPEIDWHGKLKIKKRQIPSYTGHAYTVNHIIQYKVQVTDYGSLKGEAPIYIGTTRETLEELQNNATLPEEPDPKVPRSLHIRRQVSSASTTSTVSTSEFELCSGSTPSDETMPLPGDEDDDDNDEQEGEETTLSKKMDDMSVSPEEEVSTTST